MSALFGVSIILSAGNRRDTTNNMIIRDLSWNRKGKSGSVYMNPDDTGELGLADGDRIRITTQTGAADACVELTDIQRRGTIAIPNGMGLTTHKGNGANDDTGIAPNELTSGAARDGFAGTPWHKYVPARVERH